MYEIRKSGSRRALKTFSQASSVAAFMLGRRISDYTIAKLVTPRGWAVVDVSSANGDISVIQKLCEEA